MQIKSVFGKIIFEYEKENNTINETLQAYIRVELEKGNRSADLSSADLSYADLSYADLSSADLRYADLRSADLRSADLRSADLSYADLDKRYIQIACIGSAKCMTTYCFEDDTIWCDCFKGNFKEFESKVKKEHANNEQYLKEYMGFINYLKSLK